MHISKRGTDMDIKKLLEYCYDHGKLEEAIIVGELFDRQQYLLIQKNHKKIFRMKSAIPA